MDLDAILKQIPIADIAEKFGVSTEVATQAVAEGGAALVGGLAKNAETEDGSAAIEKALSTHADFQGVGSVADIDEADGQKIVRHVFGDDEQHVVQTLTSSEKTAGIDFSKLLPMIAPIILGLVANGTKGKSSDDSGGGLGGLLGSLLGGGSSSSGGGLGDILGGLDGLFGGASSSSGGITDLLGGLFGKK